MYLGFVIPNITDTNISRSDFINNLIKNELFEYGYKNYNLESGTFLNENELINYTKENNIKLLGEVKFYNYTNYVIRLNGETIVDPNSNAIGNYYRSRKNLDESNSTDSDSYLDIFSPLQIAINQAIIESKTNKKLNIDTFIGKMSKPEVFLTISEMNDNILTIGSLIYPLLFIIILINLMKSIISEKEKKQEEGLITIGVHPSILWLSWEICYIPMIIINTTIIILMEKNSTFSSLNFLLSYLLIFLYGLSILSLSVLLTKVFKKVRTAILITAFFSFPAPLLLNIYINLKQIIL
ncbi:hypothetical protein LY90DRAFT_520204 [Neocallimastix californiae]|uniref:ABC-2 type transporter transmembrane domain-containing protein n=1 Tax=Neocallimastix californiae TaxID=1754190 RepID=A0A1Y1YEJ3_9FUNG|nr:hypothetical protein LY90DRAFT_520204 [Neocallimastix californiae]|eukprot:ORX96460.1 hypothetical protein LY90DRAFT_520204 [Neocallimastix californiae]